MEPKRKLPSPQRLEVMERIRRYEALGGEWFHKDVEPDPPGHPLSPEEVDYLQKRLSTRFHATVTRGIAAVAQSILRRDLRFRIIGEEHLAGIKGGAIITSNHFSKFENLAVKEVADRMGGGRCRIDGREFLAEQFIGGGRRFASREDRGRGFKGDGQEQADKHDAPQRIGKDLRRPLQQKPQNFTALKLLITISTRVMEIQLSLQFSLVLKMKT